METKQKKRIIEYILFGVVALVSFVVFKVVR